MNYAEQLISLAATLNEYLNHIERKLLSNYYHARKRLKIPEGLTEDENRQTAQ